MSQIRQLSARSFERMLRQRGVDAFNGAQGRILYVLWEQEQLSITQIARLTSLAKTTLTSMLDRMEKKGLIERIPDANNRRQILVRITKTARQYREEYDRVSEQMNEVFYKGFTQAEVLDFEDKLRHIIRNFEGEQQHE